MNLNELEIRWIHETENSLEAKINFGPESKIFSGHFPQLPVLPGVVQIEVALGLAKATIIPNLTFQGFKMIKFFKPIFPNTWVQFRCSKVAESGDLAFEFLSESGPYSKGLVWVNNV